MGCSEEGGEQMNAPRRLLIPALVGMLSLVVIGALAIFAFPRAQTALHLGGPDICEAKQIICPAPSLVPAYNAPNAPALGGPAITPRNDCAPSFTVRDVLDYESAHPFAT